MVGLLPCGAEVFLHGPGHGSKDGLCCLPRGHHLPQVFRGGHTLILLMPLNVGEGFFYCHHQSGRRNTYVTQLSSHPVGLPLEQTVRVLIDLQNNYCSFQDLCYFGMIVPEYAHASIPCFAFAYPPLYLCLLIVLLVVGVVSSPWSSCSHGRGLSGTVIGVILCWQKCENPG